ncbi:MAG TPA: GNAT family N-acetyltransferase [Paenisporosarcina sp.]|nr:GNAT family N-acetyltransferase [Paenisporosarcina sp.]
MNIRPIEVTDAEQFLGLSKKLDESNFMLYEAGERKTTIEQQRKSIETILAKQNNTLFVAEVESNLVGFIAAIGNQFLRNQHSAYLVLGVLDMYQGQGIATKLFDQLFDWAKENKLSRLELTVIKDNNKAFNRYKKMGFTLEGEKVHSLMIDGEPINEYYLYKLL